MDYNYALLVVFIFAFTFAVGKSKREFLVKFLEFLFKHVLFELST